jgi:PfaB family protein
MNAVFPPGERPYLGSVKANVGHLMAAAGMAGMIKVLMALSDQAIQPTPGVQNPHPLAEPGQIVTQTVPWQPGDSPRVAGVNAFGFGGVSSHIILSEPDESLIVNQNPPTPTATPLAITGMDAHFGHFDGLDAYARALFDGDTAFRPLPPDRWQGLQNHPDILRRFGLEQVPPGAYIESFDLDFMAMKIPPNPDDEPIPQQLLLLKVADAAIRDANLTRGSNVAVLVAVGAELTLHQYRGRADLNWQLNQALDDAGIDLPPATRDQLERAAKDSLLSPAQINHYTSYIGNIAASRVASLWDFNGPALTISAEENSTFKALEMARILLEKDDVEAVVVGAVDLAGGFESVLARHAHTPLHHGQPKPGLDAGATGWLVGEGAGAVVLRRAADAGPEAYATLDALALSNEAPAEGLFPHAPSAQGVQTAARTALDSAGVVPSAVGYVEMHASGIPDEDTAEITGLTAVYQDNAPHHTAFGTAKANIGHTYHAAGMAALIRATLSVAHAFYPETPNWEAPRQPDAWAGTSFWTPAQSRTWFDADRVAAVNGLSSDGTAAHLVLRNVAQSQRHNTYLRGGIPALVMVSGETERELLAGLNALHQQSNDLAQIADDAYHNYDASARYTVALVGKTQAALRQEIDSARAGIPSAFATNTAWNTPAGSAFSPQPVGPDGEIAFVYPGAFNSYPKMGYDLFHLFPQAVTTLRAVRSDVGTAVAERKLYPRTLAKPDRKLTRQMKADLAGDAVATIESGLSFARVYTRAMQDTFGLASAAAFGYSLGEGSMMWGMGVWRDGDAGSTAFHNSRLFVDRVVGPMHAVRAAWGIPADVPTDQFWAAYFIAAHAEQVRAAVERESRVYLTHINTPREVMIAGDPDACARVVNQLGAEHMQAPFSVVIHSDVMMSEYSELVRLHHLPVSPVDGVRFYSAADYAPIKLERDVIAASIARMACKPVDFRQLIQRVYDDGARVFIELGPRSTCARWVDETLGDAPHFAASIDNMSADSRTSLIRLLAGLVAHRVPLTLDALYHPPAQAGGKSLIRTVTLGGVDVYQQIMTAEIDGLPTPAAQPVTTTATSTATPLPAAIHSVHADFLRSRQAGLQGMADLIRAQIADGGSTPAQSPPPPVNQPITPQPAPSLVAGQTPLYTYDDIETFALRRIADTFGERYNIYDNRRAPRIPNGDLLLISRIVNIEGERYAPQKGTNVHAEYDVPENAWYYADSPYPIMPYSVLMEIALQPCGILSAYHGPTFKYPDTDFYFRNLDGFGTLTHLPDLRGRTITNRVTMLNTVTLSGTIIQSYSFKLYDDQSATPFYEGEATFGYFTLDALASRAGLDAGQSKRVWLDDHQPADAVPVDPRERIGAGYTRLIDGQLRLIHGATVSAKGGVHGAGYAYAYTDIDPAMWFFKNHFHQDPVMPGSIGVETMIEALQTFAITTGLTDEIPGGHFEPVSGGHTVTWKYRGQVLGTVEKTHVECQVKEIVRHADHLTIMADASLWRDDLRIYEVKDLGLTIRA